MAYEAKLKPTDKSVFEFIEDIESKNKKADAYRLLDIYKEVTGDRKSTRLNSSH